MTWNDVCSFFEKIRPNERRMKIIQEYVFWFAAYIVLPCIFIAKGIQIGFSKILTYDNFLLVFIVLISTGIFTCSGWFPVSNKDKNIRGAALFGYIYVILLFSLYMCNDTGVHKSFLIAHKQIFLLFIFAFSSFFAGWLYYPIILESVDKSYYPDGNTTKRAKQKMGDTSGGLDD